MMKRLWLAALLFAASAAGAQVLKDDLGREVALAGAGKRIATLSPFLTEAAFAVGAGAEVVGVSEYSDFPPYARRITPVSGVNGVAWERLVAVRPDLALAWKDSLKEGDLERFEKAGVPVFVFAGRRLDDVPRMLGTVSHLLGRAANPDVARRFEQRIAELRKEYSGKRRVPVLLEIAHKPLMTVAGEHFINDALAVCGAENAFASLPGVAPEIPWELVMSKDPAAIVGAGAPDAEQAFRDRWRERATLRAVKANAFVYLNPDLLFRPTPRLADGVEALCKGIDKLREK